MIIITSGDYINQDLQAEFGKIPPSFLPLANKRLYEFQIKSLRKKFSDQIILSLPNDYNLSEQDLKRLKNLNVDLVYVPNNINLAESVIYVINSIGCYNDSIRILHGDTVIEDLPTGKDSIGISSTHYEYKWEFENNNTYPENMVWCGFFSFSDTPLLLKLLTIKQYNFVEAVREYDKIKNSKKEVSKLWYDFGHANTYFRNRSLKTTEREFNSLSIDKGYIKKSSIKSDKIIAEYNWFLKIPWKIKKQTPQLLDYGICKNTNQPYYISEYLSINALNELYVYGENSLSFWDQIFEHCQEFLNSCEREMSNQLILIDEKNRVYDENKKLLIDKTYNRLEEFSFKSNFDINREFILNGKKSTSISQIVEDCVKFIQCKKSILTIMHGDFCFSNILYDSRADNIKVIDPRGIIYSEESIFGDLRYDLAKLGHSVIGMYDYIVADVIDFKANSLYDMDLDFYFNQKVNDIQELFRSKSYGEEKISVDETIPMIILLFISMLPLHSDNIRRQNALLANAVRLYESLWRTL